MASSPNVKNAKLPTAERRRLAEGFLATAQWKLLDSRGTSSASGESVRVNLRVFVKGCPHNALREVHELLSEQREVKDPIIDGVVLPGTWHHRTAIWTKDERTGESGMATYTLVRFFTDGPVTESDVVEDGCGSRTSVRFVWEAQAVEELSSIVNPATDAPYSEDMQGFSIKIGGVSRDPDTNTFSYYVTVTERKTQEIPEYVTSADSFTVSRSRTVLGLRGDTEDPVDSDGDAVSIPSPLLRSAGELIDVNWRRNLEDCTLDADVKKQTAIQQVASGRSCSADIFSERDSESVSAAPSPLSTHAPAASGGKKWQHTSKLRPDGLWDTDKSTDTEKPVSDAVTGAEESVYHSVASSTHRSQASVPYIASVGGGVKRTVTVHKTPGGLKDAQVTVDTEKSVPSARVSKSADVFNIATTVVDRGQPASPPDPTAGSGVTQEISTERSDNDARSNTTTTRVERPYSGARVDVASDVFGQTVSTQDKSQSSPPTPVVPGSGTSGSVSMQITPGGLKDNSRTLRTETHVPAAVVRKSATLFKRKTDTTAKSSPDAAPEPSAVNGIVLAVESQTTPGGRRDITQSVEEELHVPEAEASAQQTVYEVEASITEMNAVYTGLPIPSVGGGVIISERMSRTPGGRKTSTRTVKHEVPVPNASVQYRLTPGVVETTITDENMPSPHIPSGTGTFSHRVTPGGLATRTKTTASVPQPGYVISHTKTGDAFSTTETIQTVETVKNFGTTGLTNGGVEGSAAIRTVEFTQHSLGYYIKTVTTETVAAGSILETKDPQTDGDHYTYQFISVTSDRIKQKYLDVADKLAGSLSFNVSVNKFNLFSGTMHFVKE